MKARWLLLGWVLFIAAAYASQWTVSISRAQETEEGGVMLPPVVVTPESKTEMEKGGMPITQGPDAIEIETPLHELINPSDGDAKPAKGDGKDKDQLKKPDGFKVSVGDFGISLMYSKYDISNMTQILEMFERTLGLKPAPEPKHEEIKDDPLEELLKQSAPEPKVVEAFPLPNFYLGTVMFQTPGQWSIWINQKRINAANPSYDFGTSGTIHVTSVSSNLVTLTWTPSDIKQAARVWLDRDNVRVASLKHRQARVSNVDFDSKNKLFMVTMLNNQTFSAASMQIVEGKLADVDTDKSHSETLTLPKNAKGDDATLMLFDNPLEEDKRQILEILKRNKQAKSIASQLRKGESGVEGATENGDGSDADIDKKIDAMSLKDQLQELLAPATKSKDSNDQSQEDDAAVKAPTAAATPATKGKMDITVKSPNGTQTSNGPQATEKNSNVDQSPASQQNPNIPPIPKPVPLPLAQPVRPQTN